MGRVKEFFSVLWVVHLLGGILMGIEWGKRKFFISNDEVNSGFGFTIMSHPFTFSLWSKKHAIDFVEELIYTDLDVREELELLRGIDPDSGIPYLPWRDENRCPKCETPLKVATGIGPYCPNKECSVIDDSALWE
jgi:hypothetical protein